MKRENILTQIKDVFQEDSCYKLFLLSILITGFSYGIYKGMLDNFLAEVVMLGEFDRGIAEFFREIPGILLIFILAIFYMFSAEMLYKLGAVIMLVGMGMHAVLPPSRVLMILAIFVYSIGEHIQIGMKSTLSLQYAKPGCGGAAQGAQNAVNQIGTLVGFVLIVFAFSAFGKQPYTEFFWVATVLAAISMVYALRLSGKSETDKAKSRFYFHKKYYKYYMLEMFYGARKQVFLMFGPYVLILFYGASASTISLLFAISAIVCFFASPVVGRIIDRLG